MSVPYRLYKLLFAPLNEGEGGSGAAVLEAALTLKRIKLCEGQEGAIPIEVGYVKQGTKVWVAFGESADLTREINEAVGAGCQIVESLDKLELVEDASGASYVKDGVWIVEGPAQRSGVRNANKRKYGVKIWERIIADPKSPQQRLISERGMLGHIEHPKDGRTDGNLGALIVTESKLREDGVVWNKFELLDTPAGKILQEYTKKKVKWGVSSRGNGTVDDDGNVNESDYVLETWDAVMRPSTPGAFPTLSSSPDGSAKGKKGKGLGESTNAPVGDDKSNKGMTEAVKACVERVDVLGRKETANMTADEKVALMGSISEALVEVGGYAAQGAIPSAESVPLANRLTAIMKAVAKVEARARTATDIIEGVTGKSTDNRGVAFNRVIESLQTRVKEATSEAMKVRTSLEEAQESISEVERERDQLKESLEAAQAQATALTKRLALATSTIADLSAREVPSPVDEAVSEILATLPELAAHRAQLMESESPGAAILLASEILTEARVLKAVPVPARLTESAPARERALPRGIVESEGIMARSGDASTGPLPRGVALAAQVVNMSAGRLLR